MSRKKVGDLYKVMDDRAEGSGFKNGEVVRFVGGLDNDKFERLDGSDFWFLSDDSITTLTRAEKAKQACGRKVVYVCTRKPCNHRGPCAMAPVAA